MSRHYKGSTMIQKKRGEDIKRWYNKQQWSFLALELVKQNDCDHVPLENDEDSISIIQSKLFCTVVILLLWNPLFFCYFSGYLSFPYSHAFYSLLLYFHKHTNSNISTLRSRSLKVDLFEWVEALLYSVIVWKVNIIIAYLFELAKVLFSSAWLHSYYDLGTILDCWCHFPINRYDIRSVIDIHVSFSSSLIFSPIYI